MSPIPSGIPSNVVPLNMSPLLIKGIACPSAASTVTNDSLGCGKPCAPLVDAGTATASAAAARKARARIRGFLLEEMAEGAEMIVGALNNPSFGPIVVVGMGGVHAEILRDVARRYAPLAISEAREMILTLKGARLLQGYRGAPARDIEALADAVARLSWMVIDHENAISEIEINPLMVGVQGRGVTAVDAVIRLKAAGEVTR